MKKINRLPETTKSILGLPECWLCEDGEIIHVKDAMRSNRLPIVGGEYEELLKEMKIPFRYKTFIGEKFCEYWDPEYYEKQRFTLPMYEKKDGVFKYTHKFHTGKVLTTETILRAVKLQKKVSERIQEFKERLQKEKVAANLKAYQNEVRELVKSQCAVGHYFENLTREMASKISDEAVKVLPVLDTKGRPTGYFAIFNLEKIESKRCSNITITVPEGTVGLYIGSGKWQVKEWVRTSWAHKLHIEKIYVKVA